MRYALLLVVLAGCHEPTEENWYEYSLTVGRTADRLASVERQLGMLPDPTAMVMPLAARLEAMEKRLAAIEAAVAKVQAPVKVPHLVAVDGGADFGPFAGWDRYFNADIGEYVALGRFPVSYFTADCTGDGFIETIGNVTAATLAYAAGPEGTLLRLGPRNKPGQVQSQRAWMGNAVRCDPSSSFSNGYTFTDTGIAAPGLSASQLRIELR